MTVVLYHVGAFFLNYIEDNKLSDEGRQQHIAARVYQPLLCAALPKQHICDKIAGSEPFHVYTGRLRDHTDPKPLRLSKRLFMIENLDQIFPSHMKLSTIIGEPETLTQRY